MPVQVRVIVSPTSSLSRLLFLSPSTSPSATPHSSTFTISTTWLIPLIVALIAATASIVSAIVAAKSAGRAKSAEIQAAHTRDLENRLSEKKMEVYKPMIELLGDIVNPVKMQKVLEDKDGMLAKMSEFMTWISMFGSDETIKCYHNWQQAAFANAPNPITIRLYGDFLMAARRDIGYPSTTVDASQLVGMRITDIYSEAAYRDIFILPFEDICKRENWNPPWIR